jgi:hypothetical protein
MKRFVRQLMMVAILFVIFDPIDAVLGWAAARAIDYTVQNWNNGQLSQGVMSGLGSGCPTCNGIPNGGGGGGAW